MVRVRVLGKPSRYPRKQVYASRFLDRPNRPTVNFFRSLPCTPTPTPANMAGASDKARFYLEQSATELNELERKKIFTRVRVCHVYAIQTGHAVRLTGSRKRFAQ